MFARASCGRMKVGSKRKAGYNLVMPPRVVTSLVRFFYKHFYNRLAFTYDFVSGMVSRGEWRTWTDAAIPFVHGPRVLEVAFGTGNLLLDLTRAGLAPIGVDLSPYMIEITRGKLAAHQLSTLLVRARAQQLPFPTGHFDSLVMTFPPGFVTDAQAMAEMHRVLAETGQLVWVDAPYLYPRDPWSRLLNWAYHLSGSTAERHTANSEEQLRLSLEDLLPRTGWNWRIERVDHRGGYVHVILGTKEAP